MGGTGLSRALLALATGLSLALAVGAAEEAEVERTASESVGLIDVVAAFGEWMASTWPKEAAERHKASIPLLGGTTEPLPG